MFWESTLDQHGSNPVLSSVDPDLFANHMMRLFLNQPSINRVLETARMWPNLLTLRARQRRQNFAQFFSFSKLSWPPPRVASHWQLNKVEVGVHCSSRLTSPPLDDQRCLNFKLYKEGLCGKCNSGNHTILMRWLNIARGTMDPEYWV